MQNRYVTRVHMVLVCFFSAGCTANTSPMHGSAGDAELPQQCEGDDCPEGRHCEWGVCVGDGDLTPSDNLEGGVRDAASVACGRLENECSYLCDGIFNRCHPNFDACVAEEVVDYLDDYDAPVFDSVLAGQCAAQIAVAPCSDLTPDSLECEFAVVEGCPDDNDGFGGNYSPFHAASLALGETHVFRLCDYVTEYFAVELVRGEHVTVTAFSEPDERVNLELLRLVVQSSGAATLEDVGGYFQADGEQSAGVPETGVFLISIMAYQRGGDFTLSITK